jgi:hypothetical protein
VSEASPAVFQGTIGAVRTIPSRGVVSVTVECKIEDHSLVAAVAQHGKWVAVALLQEQPAKEEPKPKNREAQKAGMLCDDIRFHRFLMEEHFDPYVRRDTAAEFIRNYCGVDSRKELIPNDPMWNELLGKFEAWKRDI